MRAWVLFLVLTTSAAASADHFVTATFFQRHELRTITSGNVIGPGVGWTWLINDNFGIGAGARFGAPLLNMRPNIEGYVRGVMTVPVKFWSPLLGVEFGFTAAWGALIPYRPSEQLRDELNTDGPVYFAMHTELLRFLFGRFVVSAMGLQVGTAIPPGAALRMQFDFLTVGVKL
ncbi:MAG: hypothetical protein ACO1OB_24000 [Archangium sp.]